MSNWNYSAWRSKMSIHNHTYSQWSAHNLDLPGSQSLAASGCQCICSKLQWPKASVSSWALHVNCQGKHQGFQKVEYSQQWSCWSFFFQIDFELEIQTCSNWNQHDWTSTFQVQLPEMWLYWGGKSEAANKKDQPINPRVCNLYWTGAFKFKRFFWGGKLKEDGHWTCWILDNCFFLERGSLNFLHHWGNLSDDPLLEFQRLVRCMVVGRETTHQFIPLGLPTLIVRCHVPGKVISVPMMQRFHCMNLHSKRCEIRDKKHRERLDTLFLYRAPVIHQGRRLCWSIPFSKLENHL